MKTINKKTFETIKNYISNNDFKGLVSFCEGYGFDLNNSGSAVNYKFEKFCVVYRGTSNYYTWCPYSKKFF